MPRLYLIGPGLLLMLAGPVEAECTSGSCYDGIVQFLVAVAVYGLIGIVLLVMLLVGKWRRAGLRGLALVGALAVGVPLLSQAWQRVQLWQMQRDEVLGELPQMSGRVPLIVAEDWTCESGLCAAVLQGRGASGAYALPPEALVGRDLTLALPLADLPLERWSAGPGGALRRQVLAEAERAEAVAQIDYLILSATPWYKSEPGPLEAALGLNKGVLLRLAMAPLQVGQGEVALGALDFDLLDLSLIRPALAIPLAPGNWQRLWDRPLAPEVVAQSLCGGQGVEPDWFCLDATGR